MPIQKHNGKKKTLFEDILNTQSHELFKVFFALYALYVYRGNRGRYLMFNSSTWRESVNENLILQFVVLKAFKSYNIFSQELSKIKLQSLLRKHKMRLKCLLHQGIEFFSIQIFFFSSYITCDSLFVTTMEKNKWKTLILNHLDDDMFLENIDFK